MPSIKIRPAEPDDIGAILDLIHEKAAFDGCLDLLRADARTLGEALFGAPARTHALLACIDGPAVGIATYYPIYSTFIARPGLWLDDLYVREDHRRCGVGEALLRALAELAREQGCGRIDWLVARDNDNGKAFYRAQGAQVFEEVRHCRLDEDGIARLAGAAALAA